MLILRSKIWNIFDIIHIIPLIIVFEINSHEKILSLILPPLWSVHEYYRWTYPRYYSDLRPFEFNFGNDGAFNTLIYLRHLFEPGLNLFQLEIARFKHQAFCYIWLLRNRIFFILYCIIYNKVCYLEILMILNSFIWLIIPLEWIFIPVDFDIISLIYLSFELNILSLYLFLMVCVVSSYLGGNFTILANPFLHH